MHGEEGDNVADDQGGNDESIPGEDVVNNNVLRNMLADDTVDDGFSKMLCDA